MGLFFTLDLREEGEGEGTFFSYFNGPDCKEKKRKTKKSSVCNFSQETGRKNPSEPLKSHGKRGATPSVRRVLPAWKRKKKKRGGTSRFYEPAKGRGEGKNPFSLFDVYSIQEGRRGKRKRGTVLISMPNSRDEPWTRPFLISRSTSG